MRISFILLLAGLLALPGCGVIRFNASPNAYPISKDVVPDYQAGQTIKVSNYYDKSEIIMLIPDKMDADLKQLTEAAMDLLEQGLNHQNIKVAASGEKSVKLRVHNIVRDPAFWTVRADVNITAELGNGKQFTVFHHNPSPLNTRRAVDGAITRATEKILQHPDFVQYIND